MPFDKAVTTQHSWFTMAVVLKAAHLKGRYINGCYPKRDHLQRFNLVTPRSSMSRAEGSGLWDTKGGSMCPQMDNDYQVSTQCSVFNSGRVRAAMGYERRSMCPQVDNEYQIPTCLSI